MILVIQEYRLIYQLRRQGKNYKMKRCFSL